MPQAVRHGAACGWRCWLTPRTAITRSCQGSPRARLLGMATSRLRTTTTLSSTSRLHVCGQDLAPMGRQRRFSCVGVQSGGNMKCELFSLHQPSVLLKVFVFFSSDTRSVQLISRCISVSSVYDQRTHHLFCFCKCVVSNLDFVLSSP